MSHLQALKEIGESLGLSGADLRQFITEQQEIDRAERQRQRDFEKELKDAERLAKEAERLAEKEKRDSERELESKQIDKELELAKMEQEQRDKDRAFELERIKAEVEIQKATGGTDAGKNKQQSDESKSEEDEDQEEQEDEEEEHNEAKQTENKPFIIKGPKMPPFDDIRDSMDSFLHRFEIYAAAQGWKPQQWAVFLSALLKGKALDVYSRLPVDEANDYDVLKGALLKRFNLTEEGFKIKFRSARAEENEAPSQFITRLESYFTKWVELSGTEKTFKGLCDMMIREQYIETCPEDLSLFLKERAETNLTRLAKLAEQFIDAHSDRNKYSGGQADKKYNRPYKAAAMGYRGQHWKGDDQEYNRTSPRRSMRGRCFKCGRGGHIAINCRSRVPAAAMQFGGQRRGTGYTTRGNMQGSGAAYSENSTTQQSMQPSHSANHTSWPCRTHKRERCSQCFDIPDHAPHLCNAMISAENVVTDCGCILPVIADACSMTAGHMSNNMPVAQGKLGDHVVSVLRDTGCSTVVVRRSLIKETQLTGADSTCVLIDGTIRKTPVAEIDIDTPFFKGRISAVCMRQPLYDIIIGNVPGVKDFPAEWNYKNEQTEGCAVVTRAQLARANASKSLVVPKRQDIDVSKEKVLELQRRDETLTALWKKAETKEESTSKDNTVTMYIQKQGLLYRKRLTSAKQESLQLVVPQQLRDKVLSLAHNSILGGHQGIRRTYDRVIDSFIWPGLHADVTRYCRSCDICQRTVSKGRVPHVPLGKMPLIDTPFQRVAVDLVGPIHPATERGHRYVITLVDYATRYPEAAPLKDITAETVAEALVTMFSRIGIPEEILSDQGSQFISSVMKETSRLLSMKQLIITPYHPICNGLVERFNGTLKSMLKKMCAERPKDWDRYIAPVLFAYREAPQESLGFSPFQLLYGRSVRGPMTILRELWTGDNHIPEVKLTYQYVLDLQDRLQETCKLAREQLSKAKFKQSQYYNKKSKDRTFKKDDKVLLLLPNNENKLLMQWQGPFKVIERTNSCDYRIQLPGKTRLFHANMLKRYYEREEKKEDVQMTGAAIVEPETGEEDECQLDLYTETQTEDYQQVDINPELDKEKQNELRDLVYEFREVFTNVPKVTNLGKHEIKLTSDEPIRSKPYPLPYAMREVVDKEIATMLKLGIIEQSTAPYASPIVVVKKSDGSNRICIDFRKINKITVFDPEPMPQAEEIFAKLVESKFFSKFDLSKGYWQVAMNPEDRDITTFVTHTGLYRFCVMPFGLVNAPATFSRIMRKLLNGAKQLENYLDDVLAHASTWNQHLQAVREFLMRVRTANLTVRPSKCALGYREVNFLGHTVGSQTIRPNTKTAQRIQEAPTPTTKKQLRSFIGLAGYYRRFVPDFAAVAVPLTDLTKKGSPNVLVWGTPQEKAFTALKAYISRSPILRLPDLNRTFILQTDASNDGIGAVLLQEEGDVKHPVSFASRKLLPREKNYSTIERECLAIVWGIQKFELYLYGKTFILETDHQPLQYVGKAQFKNGRLMRWALALQPYNFIIRAIKGSDNMGADFLSRFA